MDFYISHLPGEVTEDYVRNMFDHIGAVKSIRFVPESSSTYSKVLAIVSVDTRSGLISNQLIYS